MFINEDGVCIIIFNWYIVGEIIYNLFINIFVELSIGIVYYEDLDIVIFVIEK